MSRCKGMRLTAVDIDVDKRLGRAKGMANPANILDATPVPKCVVCAS